MTDIHLSQYRIQRRLGAGGMAEVFLAHKIGAAGFSRPVAIKTILAGDAPAEAISLFLDEARVASLLQHASIVQTLDLGYENETLFIVMEYVPGPPLSRLIYELKRKKQYLPPNAVAHIGAKVAAALDHGHRKVKTPDGQPLELVHRDVSPHNVIITRIGLVKLADFGVARASIQMHKTRTGQVRGKAAYMAPEQVRAHDLDGRTDMFALGLVLYEALTGVRAYQRNSDIDSMRAILRDPVPPIRDVNPQVPDGLARVIMRSLQKKPINRYADCGAFELALSETYRDIGPAKVEASIADLMVAHFGDEQWDADVEGPAVESWQPTISVSKDGSVAVPTPKRIANSDLSPEIARMLQRSDTGDEQRSDTLPDAAMPRPPTSPIGLTPAVMPMTPESLSIEHVQPRRNNNALMIAIGVALGVGGATLVVELSRAPEPAPTVTSQPMPAPTRLPRPEPRTLHAEPTTRIKPRTEVPKPDQAQPPPQPTKRVKTRTQPRKLRPRRATKTPPVKAPPPVAAPLPSADRLKVRVLSLRKKAKAKGDLALKARLDSLMFNLLQKRPITAADRKLIEDASRKLN